MKKLVSVAIMTSTFGLATTAAVAATTEVLSTKTTTTISAPAVAPEQITKEYAAVMEKMHRPMAQGIQSADPDVAFAKGMIPHHQGAIDMAKLELKYGTDPELRKMAEQMINAQQKEIATMQNWLEKHKTVTHKVVK